MQSHMAAANAGVNVSIFFYGATGSGKSHTFEGKNGDVGVVSIMQQNALDHLEKKKYQNSSHEYSVRIRFVEIIDEEVFDLLNPGNGASYSKHNVMLDKWEGPLVRGVQWVPVQNATQIDQFFQAGLQQKTGRQNNFGRMSDKASQLF